MDYATLEKSNLFKQHHPTPLTQSTRQPLLDHLKINFHSSQNSPSTDHSARSRRRSRRIHLLTKNPRCSNPKLLKTASFQNQYSKLHQYPIQTASIYISNRKINNPKPLHTTSINSPYTNHQASLWLVTQN